MMRVTPFRIDFQAKRHLLIYKIYANIYKFTRKLEFLSKIYMKK